MEQNISTQRQTQQQTRYHFDGPIAARCDMRHAEYNLAMAESVIPSLPIGDGRAIDRMAVLIGGYPGTQDEEMKDAEEKGEPLF